VKEEVKVAPIRKRPVGGRRLGPKNRRKRGKRSRSGKSEAKEESDDDTEEEPTEAAEKKFDEHTEKLERCPRFVVRFCKVRWFLALREDDKYSIDNVTRATWSALKWEAPARTNFIPLHRIAGRFVPFYTKQEKEFAVCPLPIKLWQ
jgi:hypothetical protein